MNQLSGNRLDAARQEIRLLEVAPSQRPSDPVHCTIMRVSLLSEPKPSYETISYCCGDIKDRASIVLNGEPFSALATAGLALRRMRCTDRPRTLWLDCVCINQDDVRERGQQVAMMDEIYGQTQRNLIYLGEDDGNMVHIMDNMLIVLRDMHHATNGFRDLDTMFHIASGDARHPETWLPPFDFNTLTAFFSRPYFMRLWVFQEAVLSKKSVCHCGDAEIPLADALKVAKWLMHKSRFLYNGNEFPQGLQNASQMWEFVDSEWRFKEDRRVGMSLFSKCRDFDTYDPRDRVFAIASLVRRFGRLSVASHGLLAPDYEKSAVAVFRDATRAIVNEAGDLSYLNDGLHDVTTVLGATCPSWVLPWNTKKNPWKHAWPFAHLFSADQNLPAQIIKPEVSADVLSLAGMKVDHIVASSEPICSAFTMRGRYGMDVDGILKRLREHEKEHSRPCHETGMQDWKWALLAGRSFEGEPATEDDVQVWDDLVSYIDVERSVPPMVYDVQPSRHVYRIARYQAAMDAACNNRRGFSTARGHSGMGDQLLQPLDVVAILFGCRHPVILRLCTGNQKDHYRFVGVCYVAGIMHGEYVQRWGEAGKSHDVFHLR